MGNRDDFDQRVKAYLHRGATTPQPVGMEARILGGPPRRKVGWVLQVAAAAAVLVLAIGLGIIFQRARQSSADHPVPPVATPSTKPTPYPTPTTSGPLYPLLGPAAMHMINASTGWAAGAGTNRILRTTDGGSHWVEVTPQAARAGNWTTYFLDANHAWLASSLQPGSDSRDFSVTIYRTADGGQTWGQAAQAAGDQGWPASMDFVDTAHGWLFMNLGSAAGSQGVAFALYGTVDGGETWSKLSEADTSTTPGHLPLSCGKGAPVFVNSSTGWMPEACNDGGGPSLFVTHDGGRTWDDAAIAMPAGHSGHCKCTISTLKFSRFTNYQNGAFVLNIYDADFAANNFLYATADAGAHWVLRGELPPNAYIIDVLAGGAEWTLDAKRNTVLHSNDDGQHWSTLGTIPSTAVVMDLQFVNTAIGWALGSEPGGNTLIKTSDGGRTWTTQLAP